MVVTTMLPGWFHQVRITKVNNRVCCLMARASLPRTLPWRMSPSPTISILPAPKRTSNSLCEPKRPGNGDGVFFP